MRQRLRWIVILVPFLFFLGVNGIGHGENGSLWRVWIQIPACTLTVFCNEMEWKRYPIAVGKPSTPTPEGVFEIINKVKNPTWFRPRKHPVPPGPRNPLGHYWMGFYRGYGIHGNNNASSIGRYVSNGCIRMRNQDVAELFKILPIRTPVLITYDLFEIRTETDDRLKLRAYPDVYRRYADITELLTATLQWEAPDYPAHIQGTQWILGKKRPTEIEIPRKYPIMVDDQIMPEDGFQIGERYYIPSNIVCLWGLSPDSAFIDCDTLVKECGVQVSPNPEKITVKTIRVYYGNKLSPIRGRFVGEPLIDIGDLIGATKMDAVFDPRSKTLICGGRLIKNCLIYKGRGWLELSRLNELNLSAHWDPIHLRVDITKLSAK